MYSLHGVLLTKVYSIVNDAVGFTQPDIGWWESSELENGLDTSMDWIRLDWVGLDWVGLGLNFQRLYRLDWIKWDDYNPVSISSHCSTVNAVVIMCITLFIQQPYDESKNKQICQKKRTEKHIVL